MLTHCPLHTSTPHCATQHHPPCCPGTYPLSRHTRGASIAPGTLCTILTRVPRVPLPRKDTVVRGSCSVVGMNTCHEVPCWASLLVLSGLRVG